MMIVKKTSLKAAIHACREREEEELLGLILGAGGRERTRSCV